MTDDLYQQTIKVLAARESGRLDSPNGSAVLDNPLCGDKVTLDVALADGRITALGHVTKGCLLCKAAASVAVDDVPGRSIAEVTALVDQVGAMLKQGAEPPFPTLAVFLAVRPHKSRHSCVLLPFKALVKALGSL